MIFFFSATGNTAWAAKQLGFYTSDRLINIAKNSTEPFTAQLEPGEDIGFCFPIHGASHSMPPSRCSCRSRMSACLSWM